MNRLPFARRQLWALMPAILLLSSCSQPPGPGTPPVDGVPAPVGVMATPHRDGLLLTWQFEGVAASGFEIERAVAEGSFEALAVTSGDTLELADGPIELAEEFAYRIRTVSGDLLSEFSDVVVYSTNVMNVETEEHAFVGSVVMETGFAIPGESLAAGAVVSVSVYVEPRQPVERVVIGPVARLSLTTADLDLESDEPILALLPPTEGVHADVGDMVIAVVRVEGSSGAVVEFFAQYTMNVFPVRVEMAMLRAVEETEGLPEVVEIEIVPLFSIAPSASTAVQPSTAVARERASLPRIEHMSGLHRFDAVGTPRVMAATCLDGGAVSDFQVAREKFGATFVGSASQAAWTRDEGRRPLVLIHGVQGFPHAEFEIAGDDASIASMLCGWQAFVQAFDSHAALSDRFTLYSFGYDSVRNRIAANAAEFQRQLAGAFDDDAVFVIAHSMGGMVTRQAIELGATVEHVYALGTPFRGSAATECTRADATRCLTATNTITYDSVLYVVGYTKPAIRMLRYEGVLDLSFEEAFKTHIACRWVIGLSPKIVCSKVDNLANPYLKTLSAAGFDRPELFTAVVGNIIQKNGLVDFSFGSKLDPPYTVGSILPALNISKLLHRFNDNIVSVGSAAFLDLTTEVDIEYGDQLGSFPSLSPFDTVLLAPCHDHSGLKDELFVLLRPPDRGEERCDQSSPHPSGHETVFGFIAGDLLSRARSAIDSTIDTSVLPSGNWHVTILYPSLLSGSTTFDQVGGVAVVRDSGAFGLDLRAVTPPPVPLITPSVPLDALDPASVRGATFSLIVFDDVNGNGRLDAGESIYELNDPANTFGSGALVLDYADDAYTVIGSSTTSTGTPVNWNVDSDGGWGRTLYRTAADEVEISYSNQLSELVFSPGRSGTVGGLGVAVRSLREADLIPRIFGGSDEGW